MFCLSKEMFFIFICAYLPGNVPLSDSFGWNDVLIKCADGCHSELFVVLLAPLQNYKSSFVKSSLL